MLVSAHPFPPLLSYRTESAAHCGRDTGQHVFSIAKFTSTHGQSGEVTESRSLATALRCERAVASADTVGAATPTVQRLVLQ